MHEIKLEKEKQQTKKNKIKQTEEFSSLLVTQRLLNRDVNSPPGE